jgi:hypothetical protein
MDLHKQFLVVIIETRLLDEVFKAAKLELAQVVSVALGDII